ncbi:E3 ubiquitin-protein ligase TRIM62-like [Ylistrum balloti]|uniref:E3 ubiquitin-protein ligase TRIM62-like n=1 Tax=Ylistrum balloti TaxID=509963 RepID=UPI0029059B69|nr:E3 ubiquitin-protein ligase TRIM62-like [Ylistrum balloti]
MATAILKTVEDQIVCTICLEIFEEPKALPCLHTFCKKCIAQHIVRKSSQNRRKEFPCPICRRQVSVPAHVRRNPEEWAEHLENNHAMKSMIDSYKQTNKCLETCENHPEMELDFYCMEHDQPLCSLCCHQHRQCCIVTNPPDARTGDHKTEPSSNESSNQDDANLKRLHQQCTLMEGIVDRRNYSFDFLHQSEQCMRDKVKSMKIKLDELLTLDKEVKDLARKRTQSSDQNRPKQPETNVQTIELPFQGKPSWITGITILPSGKLLLVDHTNKVMSVFNSSHRFLCKTNINPAPYDVVSISLIHDSVIVSLPDTQQLLKCEVLQNGVIEKGPTLKTNITCKAAASDGIYVAICSYSDLQIFETDSEFWSIILDECYETAKFTYITMTSLEKKVFITDLSFNNPHIRCLDFDGTTLWKVSDGRVGFSTGVCSFGSEIMVTSWDSEKIFSLLCNGDDLKTYRNAGLVFPWKLYASTAQRIICVSQHKNTLSEVDKRTIKVFKM